MVYGPLSPTFPLGDAIETFIRHEDAKRFIEEVRGDDPELASYLRIEERELEAGGLNSRLEANSAARTALERSRDSLSDGRRLNKTSYYRVLLM